MKKLLLKIYDTLGIVLSLAGYLFMGGVAGFYSARVDDIGKSLMTLGLLFIIIYVVQMIHIILHEAGHLVAGLYSGYRFISFRIGSFMWMKDSSGKLRLKRFKIAGTGGQCLLAPPNLPVEECPYMLYHLSGGTVNLVIALIALLIYILIKPTNLYISFTLLSFIILGLLLGLTNLIPLRIGGNPNDGLNAVHMGKDLVAKECLNLTLELNAYLTCADSLEEIPSEVINRAKSLDYKNLDLTNGGIANAVNMQSGLFFWTGEYDKCVEIWKLFAETDGVIEIFRNEAKCELLYDEIIHDCNPEKIENMYDKKLKKIIQTTIGYPGRQRLLYAYNRFYKRDMDEAEKCYQKLLALKKTYPSKIEVDQEIKLVESMMDQSETVIS